MADPQTPAWLRPIIITSTVAVVLIGGFSAAKKLAAFADDLAPSDTNVSEVVPGLVVDFVVAPGSVARDIAAQLAAAGVIADADLFEAAVEDVGAASSLKAGAYELVSGMELNQIISVLARGPAAESYRVTIPEGLRLDEILTLLAAETPHTREELEGALTDGLTSSLLPEGATTIEAWEGLLFPDTYEFAVDGSARAVMVKLAGTMELRVESVDWTKLEALGLTRYDAIIVASLIESEAKLDVDRPKIASVIYNRLDIDMRLQIDATVLYAMGKRGIGLLLSDLEIESPYNTYLIDGLPPGPIGAPRLASLQAAADPLASDFLFYVLTNVDGTHSFTASYDEFLVFKNQAKDDGVLP